MNIIIDSRQHAGKHELKHQWFLDHGIATCVCKLPVGDYARFPEIAVDTKKDMQEIAGNIGGTAKEHARFRNELILAKDNGCKLYILVENRDGIKALNDVALWKNPRARDNPKAIQGPRLFKAMCTMQERYGVTFLFCKPEDAAEIITMILEGRYGV
ncbi:MAG: ERCC4 domain-containing protein [Bacteroidales bacterium]|nr:ERCC4 domain-containing protein [Candidatus Equimonas faecalis]